MTFVCFSGRKPRRLARRLSCVLFLSTLVACWIGSPSVARSQTVDLSTRHAIVIVGLPGDEEHHQKFEQLAGVWRHWLVDVAGVQEQNHLLLMSINQDLSTPINAESISSRIAEFNSQLRSNDSLWVFLLGHGSQDDRHGWFHIVGPDLNAAQWAGFFATVNVKEQVFWFTHSASGSFVKPFSLPGRVVISATDDGEVNETRFPQALTDIMQLELNNENKKLRETPLSVLELFLETARRVDQSFEDQQLLPTEHAQLDDNGDGVGTEVGDVTSQSNDSSEATQSVVDGTVANQIQISSPITEAKSQP